MTAVELHAIRWALGFTQADLARVLGVSETTLRRWESSNKERDDLRKTTLPSYLRLALRELWRQWHPSVPPAF